MEIIPLVYLKNRKMEEKDGGRLSFDEVLERVDKDKAIYFLDIDGIEKDKPNLCSYQKISKHRKIWVDAGPRVLGDVVDVVMAGATSITVRKELWSELDVSSIREITENEIYTDINLNKQNKRGAEAALFHDADGLVIFNNKNQIETDFKFGSFLKNLYTKYKIYVYESNRKYFSYWETLGVAGLLVDINKIMEFNEHGF